MTKKLEKKEISIAKIGAKGSILVALITAIGGGVAGYFVRDGNDTQATQSQRWINIEKIKSETYPYIRLIAKVNGVNYSYPSKSLWAQVGSNRERFPLPVAESYRISF